MYRYAEEGAGMPLQSKHQQYVPPQPMIMDRHDKEPHNRTPLSCAVFALICCPWGVVCALLGTLYGLCGYVDHRVNDLGLYRQRNSRARCCAITAILFGMAVPVGTVVCIGLLTGSSENFFQNIQNFGAKYADYIPKDTSAQSGSS